MPWSEYQELVCCSECVVESANPTIAEKNQHANNYNNQGEGPSAYLATCESLYLRVLSLSSYVEATTTTEYAAEKLYSSKAATHIVGLYMLLLVHGTAQEIAVLRQDNEKKLVSDKEEFIYEHLAGCIKDLLSLFMKPSSAMNGLLSETSFCYLPSETKQSIFSLSGAMWCEFLSFTVATSTMSDVQIALAQLRALREYGLYYFSELYRTDDEEKFSSGDLWAIDGARWLVGCILHTTPPAGEVQKCNKDNYYTRWGDTVVNCLPVVLCPTQHLVYRFFESLHASLSRQDASMNCSASCVANEPASPACMWSHLIVDAYIYSIRSVRAALVDFAVFGPAYSRSSDGIVANTQWGAPLQSLSDDADIDWLLLSNRLPIHLKSLIDFALEICIPTADPSWPPYVVSLIGRHDISSSE